VSLVTRPRRSASAANTSVWAAPVRLVR
jgi:hypothetical protein